MPGASRFNGLGALLTTLMLASLVLVIGGVVQRFVPEWQPIYLTLACFLVALETVFISYTVRRERMWMSESLRYLVAEIAVLVALTRVVATLSLGATSLREDAQRWLLYPLSAITDAPFIGCFLVSLFIGIAAHGATHDLHLLNPQEFEGRVQPRDEHLQAYMAAGRDRTDALRRINRRFIIGGLLLLLALSLQVVNISNVAGPALPVTPGVAGGALVYVITGFLLYSQACLGMLQSRWNLEHSVVEPGVVRRWTRSSVLLIGGLAMLMLALPRTYGMGVLDTFRSTAGFVGAIVVQAGYLLLWLLSLIVMIPLMLFSWLMPGMETTPLPPPPPPQIPVEPPVESGAPPLLPSLIFWMCMLFLVGYAFWIVLQRHPGLLDLVKLRGPLAALRRWLAGTWHDTSQWMQHAAEVVAKRLARPPRTNKQRWPALRLGRLSPGELVRYFYLSTIQRATKQGVGRKVGQTPYEYSTILARTLPDSQEDVAQLTDAFIVARYSRQMLDSTEVRRVRRHWERLRRRLLRTNVKDPPSSSE